MTKFEEEVKRPANGPLTELNNNMQEVFSQYRKMRQYADYLEYDSKQKDEYILKLENENSFMRDERTTFDSNGMAVEPKLQQQALPVVPDYVGNAVMKINLEHLFTGYTNGINEKAKNWLERHKGVKSLGYYVCQLRFQGFTIEKPQLFYIELPNVYGLKNKVSVSKVENGTIVEFSNGKNYALKLTEQEIKSIDERYWQFAVPVEDGE